MIKPILRSIASTETVDVPKFRFMEYRVGETYHNNESFIDFVTDGNELYVCAVDTVVASANKISDQANMLKLVSKGEPGRDGAEGRQGLPGHAPNIYAKFEGDQLSIYADGRRIATTTGITGPAWKPKKINNTITWERSFDDEIPASINLNELRSDDYTPILLRANSDNTKRDDETSGPANFIQWKYEGQEEWSNLISISELMNLALAGVSIWLDENDGQYHLGHREVVKASYASSPDGPQIISDVELGEVLFDAGAIPTIGGGIDPEELEERLQEIIAMIPDVTEFATKTWVNNQGFLKQHQDLSDYVKSVNGQTPDANGNVTLSVAGNPIMELRIQNQELQKKSVNDSNWVTVGSVGGGSGQGCDKCWSQQEIIDLIENILGGKHYLVNGDLEGYLQEGDLDDYMTRTEVAAVYATMSWVSDEISRALNGGFDVEYFRIFTLYTRSNSRTVAPNGPLANVWEWNPTAGDILADSSQKSGWDNHPQNATPSTPYLWMASATFSSKTHKEVKPSGASSAWTKVCLTGEPGEDGINGTSGRDGTDGADGKGIEFIYHLCSSAPTIDYLTAYKQGQTAKSFTTLAEAKLWWASEESKDWLPGDQFASPSHWTDNPTGVSDTSAYTKIEWASVRTSNYNSTLGESVWSDFSEPFIWSMWGEDGVDGDGVEYIFFVAANDNVTINQSTGKITLNSINWIDIPTKQPQVETAGASYQINDWCPDGTTRGGYVMPDLNWTDNPSDVDSGQPYEFVMIRKYHDTVGWGPFCEPKLWSHFGGITISPVEVVYGSTNYKPYTCYAFYRTNTNISGYSVVYDFSEFATTSIPDPAYSDLTDAQKNKFYENPQNYAKTLDGNGNVVNIRWSDTVPSGDTQLWLITAHIGDEDQSTDTGWTSPRKWGDKAGFNVEYSNDSKAAAVYANPALWNNNNLTFNDFSGTGEEREALWEAAVLSTYGVWSDNIEDPIYMATTVLQSNGIWSDWTVAKIKGEKGDTGNTGPQGPDGSDGADSNSIEFVYYRTSGATPGIKKVSGVEYGTYDNGVTEVAKDPTLDDFLPAISTDTTNTDGAFWHDHPSGVTSSLTHEWVATRTSVLQNKKRVWTNDFSVALWSKYGENGTDGDGVEYIYYRSASDVFNDVFWDGTGTAPADKVIDPSTISTSAPHYQDRSEYIPSNDPSDPDSISWTDDPSGVTELAPYEWVSVRKYNGVNAEWEAFSTPTIWAKFGKDGKDGVDGKSFTIRNSYVINDLHYTCDLTDSTSLATILSTLAADQQNPPAVGDALTIQKENSSGIVYSTEIWAWTGDDLSTCNPGVAAYGWTNVGELTAGSSYIHQKFANETDNQTNGIRSKVDPNDPDVYFRKQIATSEGNKWLEFTTYSTQYDGELPGKYVGMYADNTETDSDDLTRYKWAKWSGDDGFGMEQIFILGKTVPVAPTISTIGGTTTTNVSSITVNGQTYTGNNVIIHYYDYDAIPTVLDRTNNITYAWQDKPITPNKTNGDCYISVRKLDSDTLRQWSTPVIYSAVPEDGVDGDFVEYVYLRTLDDTTPNLEQKKGLIVGDGGQRESYEEINPEVVGVQSRDFLPANVWDADTPSNNIYWTDNPQGVDLQHPYEWCAKRECRHDEDREGDFTVFGTPFIWSHFGEKGRDGDGVEYVFHRYAEGITPTIANNLNQTSGRIPDGQGGYESSTSPATTDEFYPADKAGGFWYDDPQGVDAQNPNEWVSMRKYNGDTKQWGLFSPPSLWSHYGKDSQHIPFALLDIVNDIEPIAVNASNKAINSTKRFGTGWLMLLTDDGSTLKPTSVKIKVGNTETEIATFTASAGAAKSTVVTLIPNTAQSGDNSVTAKCVFAYTEAKYNYVYLDIDVVFGADYVFDGDFAFVLKADTSTYSGTDTLIIRPVAEEDYMTIITAPENLHTSTRNSKDYSETELWWTASVNKLTEAVNVKYWFQADSNTAISFAIPNNLKAGILALDGSGAQSLYYYFDKNGGYLGTSTSSSACFRIWLNNTDYKDNADPWTNWTTYGFVLLSNMKTLAESDNTIKLPIDSYIASIGFDTIVDSAKGYVLYNGDRGLQGPAGRGISGVVRDYLSVSQQHFDGLKDLSVTDSDLITMFLDDDLWTDPQYDFDWIRDEYGGTCVTFLQSIISSNPNYGSSNMVDEDPRISGTYTIKRTTTTYTSAPLEEVDYEIISYDDIGYLKDVFGENNVDYSGGAYLKNFLGVARDMTGTPKVKSFINADSTYNDNTHGTLNIAAGVNGLSNYNSAKFRVYEDGTLYATDAHISGEITATSGSINDFRIQNGVLEADTLPTDPLFVNCENTMAISSDDGVSFEAQRTNNNVQDTYCDESQYVVIDYNKVKHQTEIHSENPVRATMSINTNIEHNDNVGGKDTIIEPTIVNSLETIVHNNNSTITLTEESTKLNSNGLICSNISTVFDGNSDNFDEPGQIVSTANQTYVIIDSSGIQYTNGLSTESISWATFFSKLNSI